MMYPRMVPLRQHFPDDAIDDLEGEIARRIRGLGLRADGEVAIAVGSRGVSPILRVVSAVVSSLRALGLSPFIVPAMGSHGGGTAEGQREVLAGYGIDEAQLGVPVRSSMETVVLGHTEAGVPVHI